MTTVLSHIIQKRYSNSYEDIATDALTYILENSEAAKRGFMKLLQGIIPEMPTLHFKTQETKDTIRPDVWGFEGNEPRVFLENKFWAGLTEQQPVEYLRHLASFRQPTILLFIAPDARQETLWRELSRRHNISDLQLTYLDTVPGISYMAESELGPILAITSWKTVLLALEHEAMDEPTILGDLTQLRGLCVSADLDAFTPISAAEISDQRTPTLILNLLEVLAKVVKLAESEEIISTNRLNPQSDWERMGRYLYIPGKEGAIAWLGIHFPLWKTYGISPIWIIFSKGGSGRANEVATLVEPWILQNDLVLATNDEMCAIPLEIPVGEEEDGVVRILGNSLHQISSLLTQLSIVNLDGDQ